MMRASIASTIAFALLLTGCNAGSGFAPSSQVPSGAQRAHRTGSSGKIQHVVIIVQENRSFNNLFYKFPGATTPRTATTPAGRRSRLQPVPLETNWDVEHDSYGF